MPTPSETPSREENPHLLVKVMRVLWRGLPKVIENGWPILLVLAMRYEQVHLALGASSLAYSLLALNLGGSFFLAPHDQLCFEHHALPIEPIYRQHQMDVLVSSHCEHRLFCGVFPLT